MLKRLLVGLLIGVVVGVGTGFALAQVWPTAMVGGLGYAFAAVVGVLVGLVAGKPIWAKGAMVEVGLKSVIGAALSCGLLFGIRFIPVDLPSFAGLKAASLGSHTVGALAAVAILLSIFYEVDNSGDEGEDKNAPTRKRVDAPSGKKRLPAQGMLEDSDDEVAPPKKAKK